MNMTIPLQGIVMFIHSSHDKTHQDSHNNIDPTSAPFLSFPHPESQQHKVSLFTPRSPLPASSYSADCKKSGGWGWIDRKEGVQEAHWIEQLERKGTVR